MGAIADLLVLLSMSLGGHRCCLFGLIIALPCTHGFSPSLGIRCPAMALCKLFGVSMHRDVTGQK
jgi:hypothetical protein